MTLREMKNTDVRTINPNELREITSIRTNEELPPDEIKKDYVRQINNPYCFLVGGAIVKLVFKEQAPSLTDRLESLLLKTQGAYS